MHLELHPDKRNERYHTYAHSIVDHNIAQIPYGLVTNAEQVTLRSFRKYNPVPEWQAMSFGWRSTVLLMACPLEGLVSLPPQV